MLDPDWVTDAMRRAGVLPAGCVSGVAVSPWQETALSALDTVDLVYSSDATGPRPARVLAKRVRPAFQGVGRREARFFTATRGLTLPSVGCLGWGRSLDTDMPVVLLSDLRATHRDASTPWPSPPPPDEVAAALTALAQVHAAAVGPAATALDEAEHPDHWAQAWIGRARTCLPGFLARHGPIPGVPDPEAWLAALPGALARAHADPARWTLLHGDAHHWNVLHPWMPEDGGPIWLDWQLWRIGLPAFDVAWMLGPNSEPVWRAEHEGAALTAYLRAARALGLPVELGRFRRELALALAFHLTVPITLSSAAVPEMLWRGMLRRGAAALADAGGLERALG
jgi:hypothetical protein